MDNYSSLYSHIQSTDNIIQLTKCDIANIERTLMTDYQNSIITTPFTPTSTVTATNSDEDHLHNQQNYDYNKNLPTQTVIAETISAVQQSPIIENNICMVNTINNDHIQIIDNNHLITNVNDGLSTINYVQLNDGGTSKIQHIVIDSDSTQERLSSVNSKQKNELNSVIQQNYDHNKSKEITTNTNEGDKNELTIAIPVNYYYEKGDNVILWNPNVNSNESGGDIVGNVGTVITTIHKNPQHSHENAQQEQQNNITDFQVPIELENAVLTTNQLSSLNCNISNTDHISSFTYNNNNSISNDNININININNNNNINNQNIAFHTETNENAQVLFPTDNIHSTNIILATENNPIYTQENINDHHQTVTSSSSFLLSNMRHENNIEKQPYYINEVIDTVRQRKRRRRIYVLNNEKDDQSSDEDDKIERERILKTASPIPNVQQMLPYTTEDLARVTIIENEKPGPKSKKQSTQILKELQTRVLLQNAIVIPAATDVDSADVKRRKNRIITDSDEDESLNVDGIGLPDDITTNDDFLSSGNILMNENENLSCESIIIDNIDNVISIENPILPQEEYDTNHYHMVEHDILSENTEQSTENHINVITNEQQQQHHQQLQQYAVTTVEQIMPNNQLNIIDSNINYVDNSYDPSPNLHDQIDQNYNIETIPLTTTTTSPTTMTNTHDIDENNIFIANIKCANAFNECDINTNDDNQNFESMTLTDYGITDSIEFITNNMPQSDNIIRDSGNSTDSTENNAQDPFLQYNFENNNPFKMCSSSSSTEDEFIPNDVYFGTPDKVTFSPPRYRGRPRGRPPLHTSVPRSTIDIVKQKDKTRVRSTVRGRRGRPSVNNKLVIDKNSSVSGSSSSSDSDSDNTSTYELYKPIKHKSKSHSSYEYLDKKKNKNKKYRSKIIPNEIYFGDVQVPLHVLHSYDGSSYTESYSSDTEPEQRIVVINKQKINRSHAPVKIKSPNKPSTSIVPQKNIKPKINNTKRGRPPVVSNTNISPSGDSLIKTMKTFLKAAGMKRVKFNKLWEGCKSNAERANKILELLREKGLEGEPTILKCKQLRKEILTKKEIEDLDPNLIIQAEGRTRRSARAATHRNYTYDEDGNYLGSFSITGNNPVVNDTFNNDTLMKLKKVIDSDSDLD